MPAASAPSARAAARRVQTRMAYVFGTSACTMTTTERPAFVPGVWGPYFSAMVPGLWLNEGGQSAAGAAIDHLVRLHPAHGEVARLAKRAGRRRCCLARRSARPSLAAARRSSGWWAMCTSCRNSSATARPSPIRTRRRLIAGLGMDTSSTASSRSMSPACVASATACARSSMRSVQSALRPTRS